jgi:hypothetical protein
MHTKTWIVEIFISEDDDDTTHAHAVLSTEESSQIVGAGLARRNPHDPEVAEIGDELAAARALREVADRLLGVVRDDITESTGELASLGG